MEHIKKLTGHKACVYKALLVMKALKAVSTDSVHLLCTCHVLQNFRTIAANVFVNSTDKTSCRMFVNDIVRSSSEEEFHAALDNYSKYVIDDIELIYFGKYKTINEKVKSHKTHSGKHNSEPVKCYKAMEYFNNQWLPIKEK